MSESPVEQNPKRRRRFRFGLLELLLVTAVAAAWLHVLMARRQISELNAEIESMRLASLQLKITDESKINIREIPSIWHNIESWRYSIPEDAELELRLATEGINSSAFPSNFKKIDLPTGEHSIHFKYTSDSDGYHSEVYFDQTLALDQHHPSDWLESSGSSSSGDVSYLSKAYSIDEPLKLVVQRQMMKHPLKRNHSVDIPNDYDSKGNYLWIAPRGMVHESSPKFFVPARYQTNSGIGNRQGIRVRRLQDSGLIGLLGIQPSVMATMGDHRTDYGFCPLAISVRPVTAESGVEVPEQQFDFGSRPRLKFPLTLFDSLTPPDANDLGSNQNLISDQVINAESNQLSLFAHFQAFQSGAAPIIEILFDAAEPNRIGFLPHAAPGSTPLTACQFVTRFDARYLWRQIEMRRDSESEPSRVPLADIYSGMDLTEASVPPETEAPPLKWKSIATKDLLPASGMANGKATNRLSLVTDVADATKLTYPPQFDRRWKYEGIAARQVWYLPVANDTSDPGVTVEVRGGRVFPGTKVPIPGGAVIQNVRVTVPMPATEPVWFEIVAEQDAGSKAQ